MLCFPQSACRSNDELNYFSAPLPGAAQTLISGPAPWGVAPEHHGHQMGYPDQATPYGGITPATTFTALGPAQRNSAMSVVQPGAYRGLSQSQGGEMLPFAAAYDQGQYYSSQQQQQQYQQEQQGLPTARDRDGGSVPEKKKKCCFCS
uniref:Uncharacterized protein n=1 Tax=Chromera velia CCMP2878 TaxID=1169474 RepID=A0A0G4FM05_9ALVE|eukprot:Cvel_3505.t1-p1 / transcript=Cvel_3505.t1 / gene=Cvel_3505 / organism=Chromera_velia_CCMP2878 / gene_product=hypothetical protein / transcript_product=hypothetical protein / location=Cvel_scaffold142:2331-3167(+) / protein_length=147 / sequence_SO=supercontig / SO=protein_coding / is_pseudo=false